MTLRDVPGEFYVDRFLFALRHFGPTPDTPTGHGRKLGRKAAQVRHVLREIAVYADWHKGTCFVGGERLAGGLALTRQTVSGAVQVAVAAGWLSVQKAPAPRRSGKNWGGNTYRLLIPPEVELQMREWTAPRERRQRNEACRVSEDACRISSDACQQTGHERVGFADTNVLVEPSFEPSLERSAPLGAPSPLGGEEAEVVAPRLRLVRIGPPEAEPVQEVEVGAEPAWNGAVLLAQWIDHRSRKGWPALGSKDRGKFGKCAARIASQYTPQDVARAIVGIETLFPHSKGEPWDLMDLERKFAKALAGAENHREVKKARFLAEMEAAEG